MAMSLLMGLRRLPGRQLQMSARWRMYSSAQKHDTPVMEVLGSRYATDEWTNATTAILDKTGRNLLHQESHPLAILKNLIFREFPDFAYYDALNPVVTTYQNFDSLGFAKDHPGRARTDTYYVNESTLLRTHTSAHQRQLLEAGVAGDTQLLAQAKNRLAAPNNERFLVAADVYRRDEIDASHYPAFHQMEGVCTFTRDELRRAQAPELLNATQLTDSTVIGASNPVQAEHSAEDVALVAAHMKRTMNNM
ncbi:phenylalanyl-tRNA synthetase alpha subunit, mitochondrial, partial [Coemansia sp. RSA 2705]